MALAGLSSRDPAYWHFTANELGEKDIAAVVDCIHHIKMEDLQGTDGADTAAPAAAPQDDGSILRSIDVNVSPR